MPEDPIRPSRPTDPPDRPPEGTLNIALAKYARLSEA
jgi:hypothetical protein